MTVLVASASQAGIDAGDLEIIVGGPLESSPVSPSRVRTFRIIGFAHRISGGELVSPFSEIL